MTTPEGSRTSTLSGPKVYHHQPELRDPELQTLEALLAGEAVMPWRPAHAYGPEPYLVCDRSATGPPVCRVEHGRPA